jgi:hypothetical protein
MLPYANRGTLVIMNDMTVNTYKFIKIYAKLLVYQIIIQLLVDASLKLPLQNQVWTIQNNHHFHVLL